MHKIRKAVFPVAGLGTRFLPATKANPKEMLPIVDKPLIQYAVEEAIASGIEQLIFITSHTKRSIEDHFDSNYELEAILAKKEKHELLDLVKNILPRGISCFYVRQPEMLGLGHAVLCAKHMVGNEPFAVILADDLVDHDLPCLSQLIDVYNKHNSSVIGVEFVEDENLSKYGVIDPKDEEKSYSAIKKIVEKPAIEEAPSNLGVIGRYILTPRIFELLEQTTPDSGGEIQLTDAIAQLLHEESVYALKFLGMRYDCGTKMGYLEATIRYALKHPEIASEFREFLHRL